MHGWGPLLQYTDMPEEYHRLPIRQRTSYARVIQQPPAQIFKSYFMWGEGVRGGDKKEMLVLQPLLNTTTTTTTTTLPPAVLQLVFFFCSVDLKKSTSTSAGPDFSP
jgi:hypothetical protein